MHDRMRKEEHGVSNTRHILMAGYSLDDSSMEQEFEKRLTPRQT